MKYVCQLDYPHWLYITRTEQEGELKEKGKTTTIRSSGCGLCSAVMVADRLLPGCDFDLKAAIDLSYEVKANRARGTTYPLFAPAFAKRLGLKLEASADIEDLRRCLRTGGAAVVYVGGHYEDHVGVFSRGGHYIAAISEEPDGRFAILDPSYYEGKYEEEGRKGKVEVRNGVIALCSGETLASDIKREADKHYYLFWRG